MSRASWERQVNQWPVFWGDFNPCAAELFVSIFYSLEAGIANAISSFQWIKNDIIYEE